MLQSVTVGKEHQSAKSSSGTGEESLTRRSFMTHLLAWSKMIALAFLFPGAFFRNVRASERQESISAEAEGLSLREIVRRKIHHGDGHFRNPFAKIRPGKPMDIDKMEVFFGEPVQVSIRPGARFARFRGLESYRRRPWTFRDLHQACRRPDQRPRRPHPGRSHLLERLTVHQGFHASCL